MKPKKRADGIKIRISGLSNGLHEYHFSVIPSEIGLENNFHQPVEIDAVLDKASRQIYLRTTVSTSARVICDRCTDDFVQPLSTQYNLFYVFDEEATGQFPPEEVQVLRTDATHIDLAEDVRQMVLLSVPLKLLCREECKGLCPKCGINWNAASCDCKHDVVDSRWQSLEKLLKN